MDFSSSFKAKTRGKKKKPAAKKLATDEADEVDDVNRDLEDDNLM
jgi:hypothetical protein